MATGERCDRCEQVVADDERAPTSKVMHRRCYDYVRLPLPMWEAKYGGRGGVL